MKNPAKILLGVLSVLPVLWFAIFMIGMFSMMTFMFSQSARTGSSSEEAQLFSKFFAVLFIGHFGAMLLMVGLTIFYIVFLFRTSRVPSDKKALWAVVLFLGNAFAFPVFWYLYIWRQRQPAAALNGAAGA